MLKVSTYAQEQQVLPAANALEDYDIGELGLDFTGSK